MASLFGTFVIAWLGTACGSKTERIISKIPEVISVAGGGAQAGSGGSLPVTTSPVSAVGNPIGYGAGTTGGGLQNAVIVATCDDLKTELGIPDRQLVILVNADAIVDCSNPLIAPDCTTGDAGTFGCTTTCKLACDSTTGDTQRYTVRPLDPTATDCSSLKGSNSSYTADTPRVLMPRNETPIFVQSNKTLLGANSHATIRGANLILGANISNVIIQNLNFDNVNPALVEAGDAITLSGADHVWIDHCQFSNISDGSIDVTNGTNVTYSWNHFYGPNNLACGGKNNQTSTVDKASTVTVHHCYYDNTLGCGPKVTDTSKAHIFNNVWQSASYYSIQVADTAQATIQNNLFADSKKPYYGSDSCLTQSPACGISASGNAFDGISSTETQDTGGTVAPLPYDATTYTLDDAGQAGFKPNVTQGAGPTLTVSQ